MRNQYEIALENFFGVRDRSSDISNLSIAEESFFKKRVSKQKNEFQIISKKASGKELDQLYQREALCIEGLKDADKYEVQMNILAHFFGYSPGVPDTIYVYYCNGSDINRYYHLTKDNKYNNSLTFFFVDWAKNFGREFDAAGHKRETFRYFSDIVDNNARREILYRNPHYNDYHSLYGDEWFYSTVK